MSDELIGTRKGDYEILGVLGAGGMGKVYKVRNVLSDRIEAMKVLLPNLADEKDLADRFLREIKVLASLSHPNIAALRTALTIDNQLVMIMEYVEGTTLATRLEQGPIPCGEALNFIEQVLAALSYAHQRQVIHRDVKPANMMLTPQGVIKLMDFGIARSGADLGLTMTGTTLGSLAYMSPEQVKHEPIDARSDLYSVGVSLYEMVTGQRPFQAASNFSVMQAHLQEPPRLPIEINPDLPVTVSQIILMAMEKDPARRFQSADAFRNALKSVAAALGMAGEPVVPPVPAVQPLPAAQASPAPQTVRTGAATVPMTAAGGSLVSPAPSSPAAQATPMPPPQVSGGGRRGLYITLGALIVVAVLVAAGISVPRWLKTRAHDGGFFPAKGSSPSQSETGAASSQPPNPTSAPTSPVPPGADTATPAANPPAAEPIQPASAPQPDSAAPPDSTAQPSSIAQPASTAPPARAAAKKHSVASSNPPSATHPAGVQSQPSPPTDQQQAASGTTQQPAPPDPAQLAELDKEMDQLSGRTAAVSSSLENLQRQQNAQGLSLRGDMAAAQQRMQIYMTKAQSALQAQDIQNARKYLALADAEVERLEKFLGR
ncbi:MAG: protein kinase [Candidatus Acidiferrales bacterium]